MLNSGLAFETGIGGKKLWEESILMDARLDEEGTYGFMVENLLIACWLAAGVLADDPKILLKPKLFGVALILI